MTLVDRSQAQADGEKEAQRVCVHRTGPIWKDSFGGRLENPSCGRLLELEMNGVC